MPNYTRVNVRSVVNMDDIRTEKRNGRDVIIVPSATLPDDIIMNGIKYPASEIEASYETLNRTPAPFGHPLVNGKFISATDPEGMNIAYIGAHNENARRSGGRVFLDKVIDVEVANRTKDGKSVLNAIEKGEPIHTSTGLLCELKSVNAEDHKHIATNIYFDHDAILLNEEGAATPDQGVGMMVNGQEIKVVNSSAEEAMRDLEWAADSAVRAIDKLERAPLIDRIVAAILGVTTSERTTTTANIEKDADMTDKTQFDELSAKVNAQAEQLDKIGETIAEAVTNAVKPLTDNLAKIQANQKAKDDAELSGLINIIVKANLMDEETAKELTLNAARKLAEKAKPGTSAAINAGGIDTGEKDEWSGYDLNSIGKEDKEAA